MNRYIVTLQNVVSYYFLIYALSGFFVMIGFSFGGKLMTVTQTLAVILSLCYLKKKTSILDVFFASIILYLFISSALNNVPSDQFYNAIRVQLFSMFYFFIGKGPLGSNNILFNRSVIPVIIVGICGVILYLWQPYWYINMKIESIPNSHSSDPSMVMEMMRLSAFWPWPYWISYGSGIIYCYIFCNSFHCKTLNIYRLISLFFLLCIMILCQQRAPLFFCGLISFVFFLWGVRIKAPYNFKLYLFLYLFTIAVGLIMVLSLMDSDMLDWFLQRIEQTKDGSQLLSERADIFSYFYSKPITLFGDGLGVYSLGEKENAAITDQQYMKILYECGIVGCLFFFTIFGACFIQGVKFIKYYTFEFCILMMYLIAMTGSNCLVGEDHHPAFFWFCCGRLFNSKLQMTKKCSKLLL